LPSSRRASGDRAKCKKPPSPCESRGPGGTPGER